MNPICIRRNSKYLVQSLSGESATQLAEWYPNLGNFEIVMNVYRFPIPAGLTLNYAHTVNLPLITPTPQFMSLAILEDLTNTETQYSLDERMGHRHTQDVIYLREIILNPLQVQLNDENFLSTRYNINPYYDTADPTAQVLRFGEAGEANTIGDLDWELWFSNQPTAEPRLFQEMSIRLSQVGAITESSSLKQYLVALPFFTPISYNVSVNMDRAGGNDVIYETLDSWVVRNTGVLSGQTYEYVNYLQTTQGALSTSPSQQLIGTCNFNPEDPGAMLHVQHENASTGEDLAHVTISSQRVRTNTFYRDALAITEAANPAP